jgi:hypothetical protein
MFRAFIELLPALIPVVLYLLWYYKNFYGKDIKIYDEHLEKVRTYRFYAIIVSGLIALAIFAYLGLSQDKMPVPTSVLTVPKYK